MNSFVKLKYELAAVRKEILKSLDVVNVKDIVRRHLMDFESTIVELHSSSHSSKSSSSPKHIEKDVIESKAELEVMPNVDYDHSSDSNETYESSDECDSYRTPLFTKEGSDEAIDKVSISRIEYFRLKESEKKCLEYEEKLFHLEEELKKVYVNTISIVKARKDAEEEAQRLRSELDRMANTVRYVEDKEDEFENRYFFKINPMISKLEKTSNKTTEKPKMIAIKKIETKVTEVKSEPPITNKYTIRNIYHNNKNVPKVDN